MPFDPIACYPRPTIAQSLAAPALAVAAFQMAHADEALPASNVSPRLTTAEALALVLANSERGRPAGSLAAWEVLESGTSPTRKYQACFHYTDGSLRTFGDLGPAGATE